MRPGIALLLALLALPAAAFEVEVGAALAPFDRSLEVTAWTEFRMVGSAPEIRRLFPVASGEKVLTRFTVVPGLPGSSRRSLEGRLETILFPATVYVGRACPPQDHAELFEVVPRRGDSERPPVPLAETEPRGRWRAVAVTAGADALTARYFCFPAGHQMEEEELPPERGEEPPTAVAEQVP